MKLKFVIVSLALIYYLNNCLLAQYIDRFDGSTASNWDTVNSLSFGPANWSMSYGMLYFSTPVISTGESQVFVKNNQVTLSKSQNWSLEVGLLNTNNVQLQVFVANSTFSDYFGATLTKNTNLDPIWGAEIPGQNYYSQNGITASAFYWGSIKIEYDTSSSRYSLLYYNGDNAVVGSDSRYGIDPITNQLSYQLLATSTATSADPLNIYIGVNYGPDQIWSSASVDNLKTVPEPSALSLFAVGLGGLTILRRRRS